MIHDLEDRFSTAQALTATAVSTNVLDKSKFPKFGIGLPVMAVLINVLVAADFTTGDETYQFDLQTDALAAFGSPTVIASRTIAASLLTAGSQHVIPLPPDASGEAFYRMNYVLGGTTPTITVTATLVAIEDIQNYVAHPDAITILTS